MSRIINNSAESESPASSRDVSGTDTSDSGERTPGTLDLSLSVPSVEAAFATARQTVGQLAAPRTWRRCLREGRPHLVDDPDRQDCPRCFCALKGNRKAQKRGL